MTTTSDTSGCDNSLRSINNNLLQIQFKNHAIYSHIERVMAMKLTVTYALRHLCRGGNIALDTYYGYSQ